MRRSEQNFGDFFGIRKHQAATSACFSARGRGLKFCLAPPRRPPPGTEPGHSLVCSRGLKQSRAVCGCLQADGAQNCAGRTEGRGPGLVTLGPSGQAPFHVERGTWEPRPFLAEGGGEVWGGRPGEETCVACAHWGCSACVACAAASLSVQLKARVLKRL